MSDDFSMAITLLAVGMLTVFFILALIVLFGNWLILVVNKYFPEPLKQKVVQSIPAQTEIDSKKLAAIVTAVEIVTKGKGKVESIKKAD